jgi:hypothetical protein
MSQRRKNIGAQDVSGVALYIVIKFVVDTKYGLLAG